MAAPVPSAAGIFSRIGRTLPSAPSVGTAALANFLGVAEPEQPAEHRRKHRHRRSTSDGDALDALVKQSIDALDHPAGTEVFVSDHTHEINTRVLRDQLASAQLEIKSLRDTSHLEIQKLHEALKHMKNSAAEDLEREKEKRHRELHDLKKELRKVEEARDKTESALKERLASTAELQRALEASKDELFRERAHHERALAALREELSERGYSSSGSVRAPRGRGWSWRRYGRSWRRRGRRRARARSSSARRSKRRSTSRTHTRTR